MIDPEVELTRALENPDNVKGSSFTGAMRSGEMLNVLDGDVIVMPASLEDLDGKIITHKNLRNAQSIMCRAFNGDAEKVVEFWPNSLCRVGQEYTKADFEGAIGHRTGNTFPNEGDVVDTVKNCPTVAKAMEQLYGKAIKFTKLKDYTTVRFGTNDLRDTNSWTITFVPVPGAAPTRPSGNSRSRR